MVTAISQVHIEKSRALIQLDATDGNLTYRIATADLVAPFFTTDFVRIDATGNTVTITDGGSVSISLSSQNASTSIYSNGTVYCQRLAASGGAGGISGPGSTTSGNLVTWNATDGTVVADGGTPLPTSITGLADNDLLVASGGTFVNQAPTTARTSLGVPAGSGTSTGTNTGDQTITLSGDTTGSGTATVASTIANKAVTLAKMADIATATFIGRHTAATGVPEAMSAATAVSNLSLVSDLEFIIDGGGSAIATGVKGDLVVDFGCTILSATLLADQTGSLVVNVWKDTYANFPPTVGVKITASAPPTISSATKAQDATLTGWTTTINAGDILRFNVDSCATITRATLCLKVQRT